MEYADKSGSLAVKELGNEMFVDYYQKIGDSMSQNFLKHPQRAIETKRQIAKVKQNATDHLRAWLDSNFNK